jgi:hypothetical protein
MQIRNKYNQEKRINRESVDTFVQGSNDNSWQTNTIIT